MASDELPVAAAATEEEDLVEILDEGSGRLDIARYVDHVRDLAAGAIATFEGTTRDSFEGRRVVELRYEAYGAMARRRLAAILREARAAHSLRRLAVAHRLGTVPAGEASVFVAASAVHRADAMEACRYVIDESRRPCPSGRRRCKTTVRSGRRTASSSTALPPTALPRRRRGARLLRQQGESQRELMPNLPQNTRSTKFKTMDKK